MMHRLIFKLLYRKEGETMMAMLWAQQIMIGKKTYAQVPKLLRESKRNLN